MPNFIYKNLSQILSTNDPIRGNRFNVNRLNGKIIIPKFESISNVEDPTTPNTNVEFHVFLQNGAYVDTLYNAEYSIQNKIIDGSSRNYVLLDVHKHLEQTKLVPGTYKIVYNFFRNLIGYSSNNTNEQTNRLFISDISPNRKELRLTLTNPEDKVSRDNLASFVLQYMSGTKYISPVILNFGQNNTITVINVTSDGNTDHFYVKLLDELPNDLDLYFECWLSTEIMKPYIDNVVRIREEKLALPKFISGPNFEVDYGYWTTSETDYKSWNELLDTNSQTSQEILNKYVSSGSSINLNLNFREFENFVFYSSAGARVENFIYKLQLVESYNTQLSNLNSYTGSLEVNKIKVKVLRDKLVSGFDDFEKWMYYETTGSNYYTSQNSSSITPYPKYEVTGSDYSIATVEGKYKLYPITSSTADDWYSSLLDIATDYDKNNYNSLLFAIPEHIRETNDNDQFITFVNMIGQHFDIMYFYTNHLLKKNLREQHPKDGLSQDLIYEVTKNLGWTLNSGTQTKDLWEYGLGLSGSGDPIWTNSTTINKNLSRSEEDRTKEVWRRIFNNLPYIYKTKGTARSIRALLSAYGIPETVLTIREFGGPDNADLGITPRYEVPKYTYYLNFHSSYPLPTQTQYVRVPWERVSNEYGSWQYPDTLTFRWKMEPEINYAYQNDPIQTVLQKQSGSRLDWYVTINKNGTDPEKGSLTFHMSGSGGYKSASITDQYLYDDVPLNIMIRRSVSTDLTASNQKYDFFLKTSKYGKLAVEASASIIVSGSLSGSYNGAWSSDGQLFIGSGSNPQTNNILSGSIYELRYWTNQLTASAFDDHVLSARSYNGNTPTSSFYDLQAQFKFWKPFDAAATSSIQSNHPNSDKSTFYSSSKSANLYGFTSSSFESIVESYNMAVATVASNTPFSEKVRIDSAKLIGPLQPENSVALTSFDRYSLDSNKLMVAFSPQTMINEDIYSAIGNTWIDDYFGEYENVKKDEYPKLKWFASEYWKKYKNKNDINSYINLISIYDFSIFDQIRQTLPARVQEILGLVIEPNILERSKVSTYRDFTAESPEKFVHETTELVKTPKPTSEVTSKITSVLIGFDINESDIKDYDGDIDIINEFDTQFDDIEKEINIELTSSADIQNIVSTMYKQPDTLVGTYQIFNPTVSVSQKSLAFEYNQYSTTISNTVNLVGSFNPDNYYGIIDATFGNTYERQNATYNNGDWYFTDNDVLKATAYFESIQSYRQDNYYDAFKFYFTEPIDIAASNWNSFDYVTSSLMNPNNYPTPQRRNRFEGCKVTYTSVSFPMWKPTGYDGNSFILNDPSPVIVLLLPCETLYQQYHPTLVMRGRCAEIFLKKKGI